MKRRTLKRPTSLFETNRPSMMQDWGFRVLCRRGSETLDDHQQRGTEIVGLQINGSEEVIDMVEVKQKGSVIGMPIFSARVIAGGGNQRFQCMSENVGAMLTAVKFYLCHKALHAIVQGALEAEMPPSSSIAETDWINEFIEDKKWRRTFIGKHDDKVVLDFLNYIVSESGEWDGIKGNVHAQQTTPYISFLQEIDDNYYNLLHNKFRQISHLPRNHRWHWEGWQTRLGIVNQVHGQAPTLALGIVDAIEIAYTIHKALCQCHVVQSNFQNQQSDEFLARSVLWGHDGEKIVYVKSEVLAPFLKTHPPIDMFEVTPPRWGKSAYFQFEENDYGWDASQIKKGSFDVYSFLSLLSMKRKGAISPPF